MNLTPDLLIRDLKVALRSLAHTKGLAIAVVLTLELGIGANAAIFSVVRGALLRPLVNRDENRLIYIRQSAPGIGIENTTFSVPEIQDLRAGVKTLSAFGELRVAIFGSRRTCCESVSSLIPQALNLSPFRDASERAGALFEMLRLT